MRDEALQTLVDLYEELLAFVEKNSGWAATSALVLTRTISITYKYFIAPLSAVLIYLGYISYEYAVEAYSKFNDRGVSFMPNLEDGDDDYSAVELEAQYREEQVSAAEAYAQLVQSGLIRPATKSEPETISVIAYNEEEYELDHEDDEV